MLVGSATCYCRVPDLFLGTRSCFRWHFSVPYRGATVPFENRSRAQREGSCCSNARCRGFAVQMSWSEPVPVLPRPACGRLSSCASHLASPLRREGHAATKRRKAPRSTQPVRSACRSNAASTRRPSGRDCRSWNRTDCASTVSAGREEEEEGGGAEEARAEEGEEEDEEDDNVGSMVLPPPRSIGKYIRLLFSCELAIFYPF